MPRAWRLFVSLLGSALFAASLGPAFASSGPGGGDDLDDAIEANDDDFDDDYDDAEDDDVDDDDRDELSDDDGDRSGSNSGSSNDGDNSGSGSSNSGRDNDHDRAELSTHPAILYAITESPDGDEVIEREYLWEAPTRALRAAEQEGFVVLSRTRLEALDINLVRLRAPDRLSGTRAIATLRRLAPGAVVAPHHIYRATGAVAIASSAVALAPASGLNHVLGVIDTGVHIDRLPTSSALLTHRRAGGGAPRPRDHGSLVASIAIARGARVHVFDVFSEGADGSLIAPAANIAEAIDWMVAHDVAVINISIQGPDNPVLNDVIRRATARGHLIVAAAGNNGPFARPSFPAAFEGAIAVTAIDVDNRPYIRANRGDYIDFAAEGVDLPVQLNDSAVVATGTSFAAPVVAAHLAQLMPSPSPQGAAQALTALRRNVVDLGAPGRDPIYGWGAVPD